MCRTNKGYAVDSDICQGLANYSLQAKSGWQLVFVNYLLLEYAHIHSLLVCPQTLSW